MGPMTSRRLQALLAASVVVAAACGEVVEPEAFALPVTTQSTVVASGASSVEAPPGVGSPDVTALAANFVPQRPPGYVPEVLISTDEEILLAGSPDEIEPLWGSFADLGSLRVVDDLLGGLVVERPGTEREVLWVPDAGAETDLIATSARLLDVGYDGAAFAVIETAGVLEQVRLVDKERTPFLTLTEEEQVLALSASGNLHAVVVADEQCGSLRFLDTAGAEVDVPGPGEPACPVPRLPFYVAVALSPDAGAVAYTEVTYRDDGLENATELVVRDIGSGAEYFRRRIGEDGDRITALTFDGDRVAYVRTTSDNETVSLLQIASRSLEEPVTLPEDASINSISFARLGLARS